MRPLDGSRSALRQRYDDVLARKLSRFIALSSAELTRLGELQAPPVRVERGKQLTRDGQTGHSAFLLQSGWACSFKELSGGSRQIISFQIAGDCLGLRSLLLRTADHSFSALTDVVVTPIDGANIMQCLSEFPRLGAALLWAASRDEAMVVEHLVNIGRRNAIERTAHFFLEMAERLTLVGLATEAEFECPLTQDVLADALGLTPIHVNRVLRQLRERDLLTIKDGVVHIHDLDRLRKLAGVERGGLGPRD